MPTPAKRASQRRCRAMVLVVLLHVPLAACGPDPLPVPGPRPSADPDPPSTLSGSVFEVTAVGRVAAADYPVGIVIVTGNCPAPVCSSSVTHDGTTTGADGRYQFTNLPPAGSVFVYSGTSTHRLVCGAAARLSAATQLDVEVTSRADPQPSPTMPALRVTGQIYEMTPAGRRGVSGAIIGVEYLFPDLPFLDVYADQDGHYTACGIPAFARVAFWTGAVGFEDTYTWHSFTVDSVLDLELKREH